MRYFIRLSLLGLVVAAPLRGVPREEELTIGTTALSIGMSKARVLAALATSYQLEEIRGRANEIAVLSKGVEAGEHLARLSFRSDRLTYIWKPWVQSTDEDGVRIAKAIFGVVHSLTGGRPQSAFIVVDRPRAPRYDMERLSICVGNRCLFVSLTEDQKYGRFMLLSETLGDPKAKGR